VATFLVCRTSEQALATLQIYFKISACQDLASLGKCTRLHILRLGEADPPTPPISGKDLYGRRMCSLVFGSALTNAICNK
jgi:hypothetical protein